MGFSMSQNLTTPLKMVENPKYKNFCEQNYKWIKNPDDKACLKGWIKIRITLLTHHMADWCSSVSAAGAHNECWLRLWTVEAGLKTRNV